MSLQPYAVRLSTPAAKVLAELPEHVEETVWDLLDAAAADPWGFRQWDPEAKTSGSRPPAACPSSTSPTERSGTCPSWTSSGSASTASGNFRPLDEGGLLPHAEAVRRHVRGTHPEGVQEGQHTGRHEQGHPFDLGFGLIR